MTNLRRAGILALVLSATFASDALARCPGGEISSDCIHVDRCAVENPNLWGLRFTLGPALTPASCETQCLNGGGTGYFCLSAVNGFCLCGTPVHPTATGPEGMCTVDCLDTHQSCGGPSSSYTCYAQGGDQIPVTSAAPALSWYGMALASALLLGIAYLRRVI